MHAGILRDDDELVIPITDEDVFWGDAGIGVVIFVDDHEAMDVVIIAQLFASRTIVEGVCLVVVIISEFSDNGGSVTCTPFEYVHQLHLISAMMHRRWLILHQAL